MNRTLLHAILCASLAAGVGGLSHAAGYEHDGYVWPADKLPIPYHFNQAAIPSGVANAFDVYHAAFDVWENIDGSALDFESKGVVFAKKAEDGLNVVSVAERSLGGSLAINTLYIDNRGYLFENDIELSQTIRFSADNTPNTYDLFTIMVHEVGHFLSLDDLYTAADRQRMMYGIISVEEVRTLSTFDMQDARDFYPVGPPLPPRVASAEAVNGAIELRWHRSVSANATGSVIYRSVDGGPFALFGGQVTGSQNGRWSNLLRDDQVEPGRTYAYAFASLDAAGQEGPLSDAVTLTAGKPPEVLMAGYWDSRVTANSGGRMTIAALITSDFGAYGEVFYGGAPTGIYLADDGANGDTTAGDGLYMASFDVPPGEPLQAALSIRAVDSRGVASKFWPNYAAQSVYDLGIHYAPPALPSWLAAFDAAIDGGTLDPDLAIRLGGTLGESFFVERDSAITAQVFLPVVGAQVELYYQGMGTGIRFFDTGFFDDFARDDGVYGLRIPLGRRNAIPGASLPLEARASFNGATGPLYPYIHVLR